MHREGTPPDEFEQVARGGSADIAGVFVPVVPEPAAPLALLLGGAWAAAARRRRR